MAAGDLVSGNAHLHRLGGVQPLARAGGGDQLAPGLAVQGGPGHDR
jgi:hypothetical protein